MGSKKKVEDQPCSWFELASEEEMLQRVAHLYFEKGMSQGAILKQFIQDGVVDEDKGRQEVRRSLSPSDGPKSASAPEVPEEVVDKNFRELYCRRIRDAARDIRKKKRLRYLAPVEQQLADEIWHRKHDDGLQNITVVNTSDPQRVALAAAQRLCEWMISQGPKGKREMHVGFTGGRTPRLMSRELAQILVRPDAFKVGRLGDLPRRITFHSLVGDLNDEDPLSDPFASFLYLSKGSPDSTSENGAGGPAFEPVEVSFRSFPAPGIVTPGERGHLEEFSLIRRVTENLPRLDIIVCSCGHWESGCRSAYDHLERGCYGHEGLESAWKKTQDELSALERQDRRILGDMAWWPITEKGPLPAAEVQALPLWVTTLVPSYMPKYLGAKAASTTTMPSPRVLLLAGPCSSETCPTSKGRLLHGILDAPSSPVTDLVTDITSARDFLVPR